MVFINPTQAYALKENKFIEIEIAHEQYLSRTHLDPSQLSII